MHEIPFLLMNLQVRNPSPDTISCQMSPIHIVISQAYMSKSNFNDFPGLLSGLFPSGFMTEILHAFLTSARATNFACLTYLNFFTLIIFN
jgi:hypothetical protein